MASRRIDPSLTAEQLRAALDYDPDTGILRWRYRHDVSQHINNRFAGTIAGWVSRPETGHMKIILNGGSYFLHRLAWLHAYGEWPENDVDHIDGNPWNNALANLRDATKSQNSMNQKITKSHKAGLKGARRHKSTGRWQSQIMIRGKITYLGLFPTAEAAHQAYCEAATRLHGEFASFE